MNRKILFIRLTYCYGAVVDFLLVLDMIISIIFGVSMILPNVSLDMSYKYNTRVGASLMLGWTVLLIWADRKPVERKDILLLTAVPVVIGFTLTSLIYGGLWFISIGYFVVLIIAYLLAKSVKNSQNKS